MSEALHRAFPELADITPLGKDGGQKVVYSAMRAGQRVALKLIKKQAHDAAQVQAVGRAQREVLAADKLREIGARGVIPPVFDAGEREVSGESQFFIIESFVEGETLHERLLRDGPLPMRQALRLGDKLLEACEWFEKQGIVHRDIKPLNIMIGSDDQFYVIDLGLVRHLDLDSLTADGLYKGIGGTIGFTAPEVFRNDKPDVDVRADLYSVAIVLYVALTGRHPFFRTNDTALDTLRRMEIESVSTPADVPAGHVELYGFICEMGNRFPSRRPGSAIEARECLAQIICRLQQSDRK